MAMLLWLGYINLSLGRFQSASGLSPGRRPRAAGAHLVEDRRCGPLDAIAARAGQVVAFGFIAFGIFRFFGGAGIGGLWIAFIGWFLLQAARESYVQVGLAHALKGVRVADVMTRDCPTVDGWLNVQNFVDQELLRTGRRCFIVVDKGEITGLVTPHEIKQIDRAKWPFMTLHDIMRPLEDLRSVTPDTPLTSALESMSRVRSESASGGLRAASWRACCREPTFSVTCRPTRNCANRGKLSEERFYEPTILSSRFRMHFGRGC